MKTLVLVDGSSYFYRAFHALPDLRNKKGEPTGAIYGVVNMLRKLHKDTRADYSAVVLDAKGKTFRDEVYPQYKATREAMPDDLRFQVDALSETIRALGWPLLVIDGVEADDVIGTLTKEAEGAGFSVLISTGDKDMAQLVSPAVTLVNTMSNEVLDEPGVEKKFGVRPERFIDYLTLIGDSIDNIPGVEKVGPKTACKWLEQYGTLDEILRRADEIGGVVGENLRKRLEWLPQARELLTIKCDVPLPLKAEALTMASPDKEKLAELFDRFEFKTWRRELQEPAAESGSVEMPAAPSAILSRADEACDYEMVLTEEQLNAWLLRLE
ncbi:MAG: 5'-3' exonuclease H3TH domain-containing protein, partial [Pseudomonadota bacterium]